MSCLVDIVRFAQTKVPIKESSHILLLHVINLAQKMECNGQISAENIACYSSNVACLTFCPVFSVNTFREVARRISRPEFSVMHYIPNVACHDLCPDCRM